VAAVEVRLSVQGDEELRAVSVGAAVGHREHAGAVVGEVVVELVFELVAGAAAAGTGRVAALDHEVLDDPVELDVVVQRVAANLAALGVGPRRGLGCRVVVRGGVVLREVDEVLDSRRDFLVIQFHFDVAVCRV
jgi:hypothetical protein